MKMWPQKSLLELWTATSFSINSTINPLQTINSIQLSNPISIPFGSKTSIQLFNHSFVNSFNDPFVGVYNPPLDSLYWKKIILSFTGSVSGKQFDRVGAIWIGGVEALRFTTAEPSGGNSTTFWETKRDISHLANHLKLSHPIVASLDNLVNNVYTGIFNISVNIDFYAQGNTDKPPDLIIPISKSSNSYGWFNLPDTEPVGINKLPLLPSNTIKAKLEIFYSPHQDDEFWYGNVPNELASQDTFPGGCFKELHIIIDNELASLDWIKPVIYTGGMNPLLWRPIVPIDSFNLQPSILDISPFIPILMNQNLQNHSIHFNITPAANSFWLLSANLLLWTDGPEEYNGTFSGQIISKSILKSVPSENIQYIDKTYNHTKINTQSTNSISATCKILLKNGNWRTVVVERNMKFSNFMEIFNQTQSWDLILEQEQKSMIKDGEILYIEHEQQYSPFKANISSISEENDQFEFLTDVNIGLERRLRKDYINDHLFQIQPNRKSIVYWTEEMKTYQKATGFFGNIRPGKAVTTQEYSFIGKDECYYRQIKADSGIVVRDKELYECVTIIPSF